MKFVAPPFPRITFAPRLGIARSATPLASFTVGAAVFQAPCEVLHHFDYVCPVGEHFG